MKPPSGPPGIHPDFRKTGPYTQVCRVCGWVGSTNALARASHLRSKRHAAALERRDGGRATRGLRDHF